MQIMNNDGIKRFLYHDRYSGMFVGWMNYSRCESIVTFELDWISSSYLNQIELEG